mmetsp:Transcript_24088/g.61073  ORF Transcript_24088/g.61073 Transcript_24088/m.61073 type:complete len:112 (-) Transcript_24088:323-658(-)
MSTLPASSFPFFLSLSTVVSFCHFQIHLQPGHSLEVTKADYPLYTIEFPPRGVNWVSNLQRLLRWRYRKFRTFVEKDYVSITEPVSDIHNSYGEEAFLSSLGKGKDKGGAQ